MGKKKGGAAETQPERINHDGSKESQDAHNSERMARTQAAKDLVTADALRDAEIKLAQAQETVNRLRGGG